MKRMLFLMVVTMIVSFHASSATQFEVDSIRYEVNPDLTSVTVLGPSLSIHQFMRVHFFIPDTVEYMGMKFWVSTIGEGAFENEQEMLSIRTNAPLIKRRAFAYSKNLKTVILGDSVRSIVGDGAFAYCDALEPFDLPPHLEELGYEVFTDCPLIDSLFIPASVKKIGYQKYSNALKSITVSPDNPWYDSRGDCNAIVETATNQLVAACTATVIPDDIEIIGDYAYYNSDLEELTLPQGVTTILGYAFSHSRNLKEIIFPPSLKQIGRYAFWYCENLVSADLPASVRIIGDGAFNQCYLLRSVEFSENTRSIGKEAYNNCSSLTSIHIPEGVRLIGNKAFKFAWKVKHIVLEPNSYLVDLPEEVFNRCDSVQWIDLPNTVRSLSQNSLPNLRTFILPDCVDSIASSYTPNQLYVPESSQLRVTPQNGSVYTKTLIIGRNMSQPSIQLTATEKVSIQPNVEDIGNNCLKARSASSINNTFKHIYCFGSTPPSGKMSIDSYDYAILHVPPHMAETYKSANFWSNFIYVLEDAILPETLAFGKDQIHMKVGDVYKPEVQLTPSNANGADLIFACTDGNVTWADEDGTLHAMQKGRTTLHCTYGALHATCEIIVDDNYTDPCDVNGDGTVDISDVNKVINMMLGKIGPTVVGDVNGDGQVDISDVNMVINAMLGKE